MKRCGMKGLLIAAAASLLTYGAVRLSLFAVADNFVMDAVYQKPTAQDMPTYIIAIDEATIAELGQYKFHRGKRISGFDHTDQADLAIFLRENRKGSVFGLYGIKTD